MHVIQDFIILYTKMLSKLVLMFNIITRLTTTVLNCNHTHAKNDIRIPLIDTRYQKIYISNYLKAITT